MIRIYVLSVCLLIDSNLVLGSDALVLRCQPKMSIFCEQSIWKCVHKRFDSLFGLISKEFDGNERPDTAINIKDIASMVDIQHNRLDHRLTKKYLLYSYQTTFAIVLEAMRHWVMQWNCLLWSSHLIVSSPLLLEIKHKRANNQSNRDNPCLLDADICIQS